MAFKMKQASPYKGFFGNIKEGISKVGSKFKGSNIGKGFQELGKRITGQE